MGPHRPPGSSQSCTSRSTPSRCQSPSHSPTQSTRSRRSSRPQSSRSRPTPSLTQSPPPRLSDTPSLNTPSPDTPWPLDSPVSWLDTAWLPQLWSRLNKKYTATTTTTQTKTLTGIYVQDLQVDESLHPKEQQTNKKQ